MRVAALALVLILTCRAPDCPADTGDASDDRRAQNLPILWVPAYPGPVHPPVWDELEALELGYRWAAAESLATQLVADLGSAAPVDSMDYAYALTYLGNSLIKRRLHADPRGWGSLESAIGIRERHGGTGDLLAIWGHLLGGSLYTEGGRPDLARAHAEAALAALDPDNPADDDWTSQGHLGLATALMGLREYDAAKPEFEAAIRFRERADGPDSRLLVAPLAEYGNLLSRTGDFDEARRRLQQAVQIAEATGSGGDLLTGSLSRLSTLENRTGNLAESLELAQRAYVVARENFGEQALQTVFIRTIISYRLLSLGDWAGAAALLEVIVVDMETALGPEHPQTVNARLALLEGLLELGDLDGAARELEALRPVMTGQDPLANSNWTYFLQLEAILQRQRGDVDAARATLLAALAIERDKQDPLGEREGELLSHLLRTVRDPADRTLAEGWGARVDALDDSSAVRSTETWPALVLARAQAEARAGLTGPARAHALEADAIGRERFAYELEALPDARALFLAGRLGDACELLVALVDPDDPGSVETTWDRVVHWRGQVREAVARRRAPGPNSDPEFVAAHADWVRAQRRLAQLVVSGAAHPEDPDTRDRFEEARQQAEEAERRYVRLTRGTTAPQDAATLAAVRAALRPEQALVAYALGAGMDGTPTLGAFVARSGARHARWVPLGAVEPIQEAIGRWSEELGRPPGAEGTERECSRLGSRVRELVWDPVERELADATEVWVVPEGALHEVPWLALPGDDRPYLAEEGRWLRILQAERDLLAPSSEGSSGLLAVGGPDFDGGGNLVVAAAPSRAWRCLGEETLALAPLPFARAEAEDAARQWSAAEGETLVLVGAAASEPAFKRWCSGRAVIHLATHGVVVDEECLDSAAGTRGVGGVQPLDAGAAPTPVDLWLGRRVWLALAGANESAHAAADENEGLLTAEEVVLLDLRGTDWVVLSACQSGLSGSWAREGALGMRRAFHLAGARAVIASHWSIGDESTREWMRALYAARSSGASAGAAVQEACRAVLQTRRADGRSTHPFYWAAFTATGD